MGIYCNTGNKYLCLGTSYENITAKLSKQQHFKTDRSDKHPIIIKIQVLSRKKT